MYTIKRAAQLTGVPETSLRTWERRYGVFAPHRSESGYRLYDQESLARIASMRQRVDDGWSPAAAAEAVRSETTPGSTLNEGAGEAGVRGPAQPNAAADYLNRFLDAAARLDAAGIQENLDEGFALGSFEHVVDSWLFPALEAVGEAWALGEIDVAGEHLASHAVHRRLSAAFDAAGSMSRGPAVVVGLPPGSQHELGALAFATAIRRRGLNVLYLGANVPVGSWETAVRSHAARAVVLVVVTPEDRPAAVNVAERLASIEDPPMVYAGGASAANLMAGVRELASGIGSAAQQLDRLTHE